MSTSVASRPRAVKLAWSALTYTAASVAVATFFVIVLAPGIAEVNLWRWLAPIEIPALALAFLGAHKIR